MEKRTASTFTNKRFNYTGNVTSNLMVYTMDESGAETGTVVRIDGATITYVKALIQESLDIKMGACRDNPSPNSLGRHLLDRGKSPQCLSYILPLLQKEGYLEHYKAGNAIRVKLTHKR